jgi:PAS domain S-box-containing protein
MNILTIAWSMACGACVTLALVHLIIWPYRRSKRAHLLFGLAALAGAANALAELATFKATTTLGYAEAHRTSMAMVGALFIGMVWYARAYTGEGRRSLAVAVSLAWSIVLAVDLMDATGPVFARITALRVVRTPWGEAFSLPVATLDPSRRLLDVADALLAIYLIDLAFATWRRGDRRRVVRTAVAIAVILAAGIIQARLVDQGLLDMPHVGTFVFLAIVAIAGYPLTAEVVRGARTADLLRESEAGLIESRRIAVLAADEARQAEEWFRRVFDTAPNALMLADAGGTIRLVNSRAEGLFGYAHAELVGLPLKTLLPHFDSGTELRESLERTSGSFVDTFRELHSRRKDGTEVPVEVGMALMSARDGTSVLVSAIDISERWRSELELSRQRNELAHLSRLTTIGELAGSLAHELNQPLTAILSNAQAAQRLLERNPADVVEIADILHDIVESDLHAGEVIRRLRTMLRKGEEKVEPLDMTEIVQDALKLARSDLLNHGVAVTTDLAAGLPPIDGDRVQLLQVLLNLVLNGIEAIAKAPTERRELFFGTGLTAGDRRVHVWVGDTGAGIPKDRIETVFEPFYTTKETGMGLGLSVCRTIIKGHGGIIEATNDPGRGATFHLYLPVSPAVLRSQIRPAEGALSHTTKV